MMYFDTDYSELDVPIFDEWMLDPENEGKDFHTYMHDVVMLHETEVEFYDRMISEWEQIYLEVKNIDWKKEIVAGMLTTLQEKRKQALEREHAEKER